MRVSAENMAIIQGLSTAHESAANSCNDICPLATFSPDASTSRARTRESDSSTATPANREGDLECSALSRGEKALCEIPFELSVP